MEYQLLMHMITAGLDIDNSSVQELQVISGTFNAEYGQALSVL